MKYKNIGIVTTWFERGAAYVSRQYMDAFQGKCQVHIYARGGEFYAQRNANWDYPNVTWGKKVIMPNSVANYIDHTDFKKWLLLKKIDMVFFNEQQYWQPVILCKRLGIMTCSYVDYYTEETIPLFALFDILICNTKRHYKAFSWHPQVLYIPWGTCTDIFVPPSNKLFAPEGKVRFFHSAGMSPYRKGTDYVVRAFHILVTRGVENIRLILHLQADLFQFFPELRSIVDILIQKKYIELITRTVDAPGLYHKGDVYVYPSRLDGIGLTIAEALSCGLPIIVPDNPPMNEFALSDGSRRVKVKRLFARSDGYYWPQCSIDVQDLANDMLIFLHNINRLKHFSEAARNCALEHFNWKKNAHGLPELLFQCKTVPVEKSLLDRATKFDNRKYPGITKFPGIFSLMVKIKNIVMLSRTHRLIL